MENEYKEVCLENQKMIKTIYLFIKSIESLPDDLEKNRNIKLCLQTNEGNNLKSLLQ